MGDAVSRFRFEWQDSDAEFLRWVAGWLDKLDPILAHVFRDEPDVVKWLAGNDVQERLRLIAAGHTDLGVIRG